MPEHKALLVRALGGARGEVGLRNTPSPGPGQVLVRNVAVALNPADAYMHKFGLFLTEDTLPATLGFDGAGEVAELGPGVGGWNLGISFYEGVVAKADQQTFQEYTIVNAKLMSKVPPNITIEQAATIPAGFMAAALGIYVPKKDEVRPDGFDFGGVGLHPLWLDGGLGKYTGQAALVVGGASSVGQYALQLLAASGFSPLLTTASKHNEAYCKAAGATHVIDYKEVPYAELPAKIREILQVESEEKSLAFIYDAACKDGSQEAAFSLLAPGGLMVTAQASTVGVRGKDDELGRRVIAPYGLPNEHEEFSTPMCASLTELFAKGVLKPNNVKLVDGGLAGIPDALDSLLSKGVSGYKLVVRL
ncbi:GroES-like protein [Auriculariales sp. MPI-PUGE-AT-0066]|nr:GroES-like protein [Auriculariales sp. MPI-PUGE-AT-0066]